MPTADADERVWQALCQTPLFLDQTSQPLAVDREQTLRYYIPLARLALDRRARAAAAPGRTLIAVAGPPGSGKSAFAAVLTAVINLLAGQLAALVGLDGWHYPNAYLDTHTITRSGETFPLRRIKGAPETYDLPAIAAFLAAAAAPAADDPPARLSYPVYSRAQHDPLPSGVLEPWQRMVVLEGNYWLLDEPAWRAFWPFFNLRIFLTAEPAHLLAGLRERHLRGQKDPAFVEKHLAAVDLPNIARVLNHSGPADVIVHKADSRQIAAIMHHTI